MSIFGNIQQNGVFSGFGKPYIKLEFDDNTALLDFQKRMNESGEAQEAEFEDGEFRPIEGVKMLSEKDFYKLIEREPKYINLDSEKYNYTNNKIKPITDSNGIIKSAYSFRTPIGEIFCWTDFFHIVSGNSSHQDRTRILPLIKPTLEDPNCIFENGKENYFIKPFITEKGVKIIFAFIPTLKENSRVKTLFERPKKEIYNLYTKGGGNLYQKFDILDGSTTLNGVANQSKPFKVVEFRLPCKFENNFSDNQIFDKKNLSGYGDKYVVVDNRKRARKEPGELVANKNLVFTKEDSNNITNYNHTVINNPDYKEITILFQSQQYETHFPFFHVTKKARKETHSTQTGKDGQLYDGHIVYIKVPVEVEKLYNLDRNSHTAYISLSYYKDLKNKAFKQFLQSWQNTFNNYKEQIKKIETNTYLNSSTKESWIKEQKEYLNDALKAYKYNCDFYGIENDSEKEIDLGKTANPYLYNNNEIIDCRGLKPTYKILDNYDNFFDVADSKTNFAGFGLTDTKKLISETCRAHWKDCKKIAEHLKGDSLLQSCFNLWHWLRFNIRYEYDKEGREEIRTPLRVWQDRARGVDCDCLSVFSWCVLRCMGYDPVFELVAFKNRPQFSHIFINCDGVVVDRVWFVFNSRPPLVTKRELFRVDLINNLGQLF